MRKVFKIVLAIFAIIIIIVVAFGALIFLDLAAYTATASQTLTPTGLFSGQALVVYDPGLSGASTRIAQKVAEDLQAKNLTVTLAGIKSSAATNTTDYDVIVVGGPVYAGGLTNSVKDFLSNLPQGGHVNPTLGHGIFVFTRLGVFGSGQGETSPEDIAQIRDSVPALQNGGIHSGAIVVKIGETEDLDTRASVFVSQLVG